MKNQLGFSLLETMVVVVLMSIMAFIATASFTQQRVGNNDLQARIDLEKIVSDLKTAFQDNDLCFENLRSVTVVSGRSSLVSRIVGWEGGGPSLSTHPIAAVGSRVGRSGFPITDMTLSIKNEFGNSAFLGEFTISVQNTVANLQRSFPIYMYVNGSGSITQCGLYLGNTEDTAMVQAQCQENPNMYFDPSDGLCKNRYIRRCYLGPLDHVACSDPRTDKYWNGDTIRPSTSTGCRVTEPIVDPSPPLAARTFERGMVGSMPTLSAICRKSSPGNFSARCVLAEGTTTAPHAQCELCCRIDLLKPEDP